MKGQLHAGWENFHPKNGSKHSRSGKASKGDGLLAYQPCPGLDPECHCLLHGNNDDHFCLL